jgi:diguanylate cyclase (GGDEF)-like protein
MAPQTSTAHAIDLNRVRQLLNPGNAASESVNPVSAARYRLLNTLQTTLDLDELLTIFRQELEKLVAVDGMLYCHDTQQIECSSGQLGSHHCHYRLITQRDHLGELGFYRESRFSEGELETIEALLGILLPPLRNTLLYRQAVAASLTDPLTGAGNRLAMTSHLKREISLARRYAQPLSALVIDIDKFKRINDSHGHAIGDLVLQELASIIRRINRSTDLCFRYGGEEFVVLLSNTDCAGAVTIADRLRNAVAQCNVCTDTGPLQISISVGAATIAQTDNELTLIQRADKAMYQSKNNGGNKVSFL